MKYAYLAASLPLLIQDEPPPMSAEAFLFHCTGALSSEDWEELERVLTNQPEGCHSPAARGWLDFDTQIRNATAEVRAKRHGVDPKGYMNSHHHFHGEADQSVIDAYAKSTPREREWALDQVRWTFLEHLTGSDPFGFAAVLAHAIQLRLAERWAGLDAAKGATSLEHHVNQILEPTSTETP